MKAVILEVRFSGLQAFLNSQLMVQSFYSTVSTVLSSQAYKKNHGVGRSIGSFLHCPSVRYRILLFNVM